MVSHMKTIFSTSLLTSLLTLWRVPALVLGVALCLPAFAAPESGAAGISQQQAVGIAQSVHPGRVLSVKQKGSVYRVKSLSSNGEVRIIVIDASSGQVISGR